VHEAKARELHAKIGELVLELDARRTLAALSGKPVARGTRGAMSPGSGLRHARAGRHDLKRVAA
jgi:hypothetical protein